MKNRQKFYGFCIVVLLIILNGARSVIAQSDACFIYGKITTISENEYIGAIRWGSEEVYWADHFNSIKAENDFVRELSRKERHLLDRRDSNFEIFGLKIKTSSSNHSHTFACQFGDIKSIEIIDRDEVELELKNGEIYNLEGGSNDIGTDLLIMDKELGKIELKWGRIEKIEFMKTPEKLAAKFGSPLFGVVETHLGDFEGLVQWDHDERISIDVLDGKTEDGDISIPFSKIRAIEKRGRGSLVTVSSGRELYVTGSNDVNSDIRGIIVLVPGMGMIDVTWRDFKKVTFDHMARNLKCSYDSFKMAEYITGTVKTTRGAKFSGKIVYDLDEFVDVEMLDGDDDDLKYLIPFKHVKSIRPKNYNYSVVTLKDGTELLLGDRQDVTNKNDGLLVFGDDNDKKYIAWEDVEEVVFK